MLAFLALNSVFLLARYAASTDDAAPAPPKPAPKPSGQVAGRLRRWT